MAKGARKNAQFKALSTAPSFNKTPIGSATPPVPYPVTEDLSSSAGAVASVRFNGDAAYVLQQSSQPSCKGDAAGSAKGVKSGTTSGEVKPVAGATTVRANKQPVIRDADPCTLNGGNCPGIYQSQPEGSANSPDNPIASTVHPQTEKETGFWGKASPWVHGALGVASFVPGISLVTGAADAAIYAAEGELVEAGLAAASMIPGGKLATTAGKAGKAGLKMLKGAEDAAKVAKEAKAAEEAAKAAKLAKEAKEAEEAAKLAKEAKAAKKGKDNTQVKGGPCDHLRQGKGKGPYRGGAHSKTSKPTNDSLDSHHMPAKDSSPLKPNEGPAIQMDPKDHAKTSSNGQMSGSRQYREILEDMLENGKWREALKMEVSDVRRVAKEIGSPGKYNEAMLEMLEYFKCLEENNLLGSK
jgi:Domain of unknown function (DUF4150)